MYAHELLTDIEELMHEHDDVFLPRLKQFAATAQYFYFGHEFVLGEMFGTHGGGVVLKEHVGRYKRYLELPYKQCCFEWIETPVRMDNCLPTQAPSSKKAAFLCDYEDIGFLSMVFCAYFVLERKWNVIPFAFFIDKETADVKVSRLSKAEHPLDNTPAGDIVTVINCLTLLNCKNVHTEKIIPPVALQKKRTKACKLPLISYHTVTIDLGYRKQSLNLSRIDPLNRNRLHLCRGHFKEYTEDRPLFGKVIGLWWWQPHVRGQNKRGMVLKDYEVNMPREEVHA